MKNIGKIPIPLLLCLFGLSHATERVCSPALPEIAESLGVADSLVQMSSSVYFFGFALGIIILGRLSDIVGRRPLVLMGLGLYCVSSIMCSHAESGTTLLIFRFTQAFGASVGSVLAQAMARDSFEGRDLAQVYVGVAISLSFIPSIGLIMGGYLVEYISWNSNFWLLASAGVLLLTLCSSYLPETNRYIARGRDNTYFNILKKVVTDRKVLLYALIVGCMSGMTIGFYVEAPFIFIEYLGLTPSEYGKIGFGIAAANLAGGLINRYLVKQHVSSLLVITWGIGISIVGCIIMFIGFFFLNQQSSYIMALVIVVFPSMLHAMGHTFTVPHILHFALEDYREVNGTVGSIFGSFYYMLVAVVSFVISKIHGISITAFATLFLGLSITCGVSFLLVQMINTGKVKARR
jgi:MFS transporter, DHA1 family, multidrug resistance protein